MNPRLAMAFRPVLTALGLLGLQLSADTIVTNCTEAALDAALAGGGRIVLACNGTLTHRTTKLIARDTTLEAASGAVTLSGGGSNRLFTIQPGVTLNLRGLNLVLGNHQGAPGGDGGDLEDGETGQPGYGAAVFNDGGTLIATQVTFATNKVTGGKGGKGAKGQFLGTNGRNGGDGGTAGGAAVFNRSGTVLLTNCVFAANQATGGQGGDGGDGALLLLKGNGGDGGDGGHAQGGALYSEGTSTVIVANCTFSDNSTQGGPAGAPGLTGGGTSFDGVPGNSGRGEGGALYAQAGSVLALGSTFDHNRVQGADGLDGLDGFDSRVGMDGRSGGAGRGGALAFETGSAAVTNSTFYANRAAGGNGGNGGDGGDRGFGGDGGDGGSGGKARGGASYHASAHTATYVHCTFSSGILSGGAGGNGGAEGNSTADPGGRGSTGATEGAAVATDSAEVELVLSLLAYGAGGSNAHGPIRDGGFNFSSDATPTFTHPNSHNLTDPRLSTLSQNGGPTQTIALNPSSPAIDQVLAPVFVETDQRGYLRSGAPDAGAYEYLAALTLEIEARGDGVVVSWPVTSPPFQLQSSLSIFQPDWQVVSGVAQVGSVFVVTNAVTAPTRYYRLTQ